MRHAYIRYALVNVGIWGASDEPIVIQDSLFSNSDDVGVQISVDALDRVQLLDVEFMGNVQNRIRILRNSDTEVLMGDVVLKPFTGLDGYLFEPNDLIDPYLIVPENITLTMEVGTTLIMSQGSVLTVQGFLWATGTIDDSVYFTRTTEMALSDGQWSGNFFTGCDVDGSTWLGRV